MSSSSSSPAPKPLSLEKLRHLICTQCKEPLVNKANTLGIHSCGIHYACSDTCINNGCGSCICDACEKPVDSTIVVPDCLCIYHGDCLANTVGGVDSKTHRCHWCDTVPPETSGIIRWIIPKYFKKDPAPAALPETKLKRHQWTAETLRLFPAYGVRAILQSKMDLGKLEGYGFTPSFMTETRGMTALDLLRHLAIADRVERPEITARYIKATRPGLRDLLHNTYLAFSIHPTSSGARDQACQMLGTSRLHLTLDHVQDIVSHIESQENLQELVREVLGDSARFLEQGGRRVPVYHPQRHHYYQQQQQPAPGMAPTTRQTRPQKRHPPPPYSQDMETNSNWGWDGPLKKTTAKEPPGRS